MSPTEILNEIQKLPFSEQLSLLSNLSRSVQQATDTMTEEEKEAEVVRLLMERGILQSVPQGLTDEEEEFEPIQNTGKPLSEIIIEERR